MARAIIDRPVESNVPAIAVMTLAIYVEAELGFYHYTAIGVWAVGLGSLLLSSGVITPIETQFWGLVSVEDTLNAPPGAPANKSAWLIGTAPTGSWAGKNNFVAYNRAGVWEYLPPYQGARIYEKDQAEYLTYKGSAWANDEATTPSLFETTIINLAAGAPHTIIDVLDLGEFESVELIGAAINCNIDTSLLVRVSQNNGSSFDASGYISEGSGAGHPVVITNTGTGSIGSFKVVVTGLNKLFRTSFEADGKTGFRNAEQLDNALRLTVQGGSIFSGKLLIRKMRG